ncbi:MAG: hypothetical protein Q8J99_06165, partial [Sulfuritalea sp.]|nr:hypothetical protein [Sulfuritalea sp.]
TGNFGGVLIGEGSWSFGFGHNLPVEILLHSRCSFGSFVRKAAIRYAVTMSCVGARDAVKVINRPRAK